jgi:nicotinamidase-related amidase
VWFRSGGNVSSKPALLLIDVQVNMFDPASPVAGSVALLERLRGLLQCARSAGAPVFFVRNTGGDGDPDAPGTPGWELHPGLQPAASDAVLDKTTCDSFASTPLKDRLAACGVFGVVIAGLQSEFCVRETALGALGLGYEVTLASDGHSTYDGRDRSAVDTTAAVNEELASRVTLLPAAAITFAA